jgi:hypothetical protein
MGKHAPVVERATRQERISTRRPLGRLASRLVQAATLKRYRIAMAMFIQWLLAWQEPWPVTRFDVDLALAKWIEVGWQEGETLSVIGHCLSGWMLLVPGLRGELNMSWRLHKAWRKLELPMRAWAAPKFVVRALAAVAQHWDMPDLALCICLGFECFLRTTEIFLLLVGDITFGVQGLVHLGLGSSKGATRSGDPEAVSFIDLDLSRFLRRFCRGRSPGERLLQRTAAQAREAWAALRVACNLAEYNLQWYSLRRGGASDHFRRLGSYDKTLERGRWGHLKTAKTYVNIAMQDLAASQITASVTKSLRDCGEGLAWRDGA